MPPVPIALPHVVDELFACHEEIRYHLALAQGVVLAGPALPAERISGAAAEVARCFTVTLPLHAADEDLSIRPRLEAIPIPRQVRQLLQRMTSDHDVIRDIVAEVLPCLGAVAANPVLLRSQRVDLAAAAAELDMLFDRHLAEAEGVLFPALRHFLDAEDQAQVRREMSSRR